MGDIQKPEPVAVEQGDRYRHLKRGTVYEVIGTAELQAEQLQGDHAALTIYRGEDGKLWARNTAEFHDGRFERLAERARLTTDRSLGAGNEARRVLTRITVAHNRLNRSEITAAEFDEYALGLLAATPPVPAIIEPDYTFDQAWDELVNKDDRTSPEEYPEFCLISHDELRTYMETRESVPAISEEDVTCPYCEGTGHSGGIVPSDPELCDACEVCLGAGTVRTSPAISGEGGKLREALATIANALGDFDAAKIDSVTVNRRIGNALHMAGAKWDNRRRRYIFANTQASATSTDRFPFPMTAFYDTAFKDGRDDDYNPDAAISRHCVALDATTSVPAISGEGEKLLEALLSKVIHDRNALEGRNANGGLGADTHAAIREAIMTFDAVAQHLATPDAAAIERAGAGWIVGSADRNRWRTWADGECRWGDDREQATRYARRADAEAVHAEDDDAWIVEFYDPSPDAAPIGSDDAGAGA